MSMKTLISRRELLRGILVTALTTPDVFGNRRTFGTGNTPRYPERVERLVGESLVIDMLNQFLYRTDKQDTLNEWLSKPISFHSRGLGVRARGCGNQRIRRQSHRADERSWRGDPRDRQTRRRDGHRMHCVHGQGQ